MFQRILVAIDDSARAPLVLQAALEQARFSRAELRVLRVIAIPPDFPPAAHLLNGDPLPMHMRKVAEDRLGSLLGDVRDVRWDVVIDESHSAAHSILEQATNYRADLIVIGSHGYGALDRLLGTTAAKVVNLAEVNVLVVRPLRRSSSAPPPAT